MKQFLIFGSALTLIISCSKDTPTSSVEPVPVVEKDVEIKEQKISSKEYELLAPYIEDIRKGIVEFSPDKIGICEGQTLDCENYLGTEVLDLEPGKYMVRGEFQAPKVSPEEGWNVTFTMDCVITRTKGTSKVVETKHYEKTHDVNFVDRTEHGYRLSPLHKITSPSSRGDGDCTWEIRGNNLAEPVVWSGRYTVPAKEKQ